MSACRNGKWAIARCFEVVDQGKAASRCSCQGWGQTQDYLQSLVGEDTSAIDRHLALFKEQAAVVADTCEERKAIITAKAGRLGLDRVVLDTEYGSACLMLQRRVRATSR